MNIKQLNEKLLKTINESTFKNVYLVYEREYVNTLEDIQDYTTYIYTEKGLIEYAEEKRQDFIELENYRTPIVDIDTALMFLDMAEYEVTELMLIN